MVIQTIEKRAQLQGLTFTDKRGILIPDADWLAGVDYEDNDEENEEENEYEEEEHENDYEEEDEDDYEDNEQEYEEEEYYDNYKEKHEDIDPSEIDDIM